MPLTELKSYKPICDWCGKVGSIWQALPEKDKEKAVPEGWQYMTETVADSAFPDKPLGHASALKCDECLSIGKGKK